MVLPGQQAGLQPGQIPADGLRPLLQLPVFALNAIALHLTPPEGLGRLTTSSQRIAETEILKPFETDQEAGAFKMIEATEILKIRSPAAIHLFFGHNQGVPQDGGGVQIESVQPNIFG